MANAKHDAATREAKLAARLASGNVKVLKCDEVSAYLNRGKTREGTIGRNRLNTTHVNLFVFNTAILRRRPLSRANGSFPVAL